MKRGKVIVCLLALVLFVMLVPAQGVYAEGGEKLHEEGFSADYNLKGVFGTCEEYFQAGDWNIKNAKLTLFYTASNLVREEVSDFTVSLNGEPIYSQKVPLTAGETQKLTITLPTRLVKNGINTVRIESYIRTNDEDPCEDDISGASWMVIRRDSHVSVSYRTAAVCRNVADVYQQITSIEGLENEQSAVFLPEKPTENELTSAAYLLAGISSNAVLSYDQLKLITTNKEEELSANAYGAYIAEYDRLPAHIRELLSGEQKSAAEEGAVITFAKYGDSLEFLIVTGRDEMALQNACRLFGNQSSMHQTKAVWRKVSAQENTVAVNEPGNSVSLTETGSYVSGPFKQTAAFTVEMNANKCIAAGSKVEICFRYAQNLDFDRSLVTVYIGDTPIGSKKLEQNSANGDILKLDIPENLNITGSFMVNVTFDLEMKDLICDVRRQDMPWAYVTNESSISLYTKELPWMLFDYYPGPFVYDGRLNNVTVILPVQESEKDREAMRKIVLTMGRYLTDNSGMIRVCRADNMQELTETNIISIGCLAQNPIVQQINNQLYFQFSPEGTTIRSNEKMKVEPNYGAALGTAQLLYSPYSAGKYALLIVSGVTEEAMLQAAGYLGDVKKNWQIYGDGFVADKTSVHCYRFGPDNSKKDSFVSGLKEQSDALVLLITVAGILLLMGISFAFLWNKHRKER